LVFDFCLEYDFRIQDVVRWIRSNGFKRVLIQLPEGLMRCFETIVSSINEAVDVDVVVSANPSYGPCLVDEISVQQMGLDAVIHFGHLQYPYYRPSVPTLFIPAEWAAMDLSWLEKELSRVTADRNAVVVTVSQHLSSVKTVCKRLGIEFGGIMLGCYLPKEVTSRKRLVVVAGGDFHCISAYLHTVGKDVDIVCIDPYAKIVRCGEEIGGKVLRVRMWKVSECLGARKWLVVNGFLGQNRQRIVDEIVRKLLSKNIVARKVSALRIDEEYLRNLGAETFDCIVIVACPRIAIDDLQNFEKPVLTPGEAMMVLSGSTERYVYPW